MATGLVGAINRIAKTTVDTAQNLETKDTQRRNQVVDTYGMEYQGQGDLNSPARIYISVSPDMIYYERFEFKLIIDSFVSTSGSGMGSAIVQVDDTELKYEVPEGGTTGAITPNPHTHTTRAHTHNINSGITIIDTDSKNWTVSIDNVDVSAYFMAQHDGAWIDGEGIFPSANITKNYDVLEAASDMYAAGETELADKLTSPGYKTITVASDKPFSVKLHLYLKYSHTGR